MTAYIQSVDGNVWRSLSSHVLREGEKELSVKAGKALWTAQVKAELVALLEGATQCNGMPRIYTALRSAAPSGMSRVISAHIVRAETGEIVNITWHYAQISGAKLVDSAIARGVRVQGAGMDMGYHLADCIACATVINRTGAEYPGFVHAWL